MKRIFREDWKSGPENIERGKAWLGEIYKHNYATIARDHFAAHRDFRWISEEITYGLYLSDHRILDGVDTELVVLAGLMMQNLKRETGWHLRGIRRIGVESRQVEQIWECVSACENLEERGAFPTRMAVGLSAMYVSHTYLFSYRLSKLASGQRCL
jgi:hypothetical protein